MCTFLTHIVLLTLLIVSSIVRSKLLMDYFKAKTEVTYAQILFLFMVEQLSVWLTNALLLRYIAFYKHKMQRNDQQRREAARMEPYIEEANRDYRRLMQVRTPDQGDDAASDEEYEDDILQEAVLQNFRPLRRNQIQEYEMTDQTDETDHF